MRRTTTAVGLLAAIFSFAIAGPAQSGSNAGMYGVGPGETLRFNLFLDPGADTDCALSAQLVVRVLSDPLQKPPPVSFELNAETPFVSLPVEVDFAPQEVRHQLLVSVTSVAGAITGDGGCPLMASYSIHDDRGNSILYKNIEDGLIDLPNRRHF